VHAIVLAGGRGVRLLPHTEHTPKALVPLGEYSILEIIVRQLAAAGFARVTLCTAHLGTMIRERFGDGGRTGVAIDYTVDPEPLGTAGPLRLLERWTEPALVVNCDILTTMDFADIHRRHVGSGCPLTVVAVRRDLPVTGGLLDVGSGRVRRVWENPVLQLEVAAGVYVVDPCARGHLGQGGPVDMPELVAALLADGQPVAGHLWTGEWRDIGTEANLAAARRAVAECPQRYLPG
jgi:NDP-sugar pyrophosphorylase family protein